MSAFREEEQRAPYMGMIGISRWSSNGANLFASKIKHRAGISITIKHGGVREELGREWYHGHEHIVVVNLSPHQWAELLTNFNQGDGVPCTISWTKEAGYIQQPTNQQIGIQDFIRQEKKHFDERSLDVEDIVARLDEMLSTGKLSKPEIRKIREDVASLNSRLKSNYDFAAKSIQERAEKIMAEVKQEIEARFENYAMRLTTGEDRRRNEELECNPIKELE